MHTQRERGYLLLHGNLVGIRAAYAPAFPYRKLRTTTTSPLYSPPFLRRLPSACCSNDMERKGADSVAHGGTELPEFAINILAKLETLAAKAGYNELLEGSSSSSNLLVSPRGPSAFAALTRRGGRERNRGTDCTCFFVF